jgi:hypothetical protein
VSGFALVTKKVGSRSYTVLGGYQKFMIPVESGFHKIWYPFIRFSFKNFNFFTPGKGINICF